MSTRRAASGRDPAEVGIDERLDSPAALRLLSQPCVVHSTGPDRVQRLSEGDTLEGADVLPGFTLSVRDLLGELDNTPEL